MCLHTGTFLLSKHFQGFVKCRSFYSSLIACRWQLCSLCNSSNCAGTVGFDWGPLRALSCWSQAVLQASEGLHRNLFMGQVIQQVTQRPLCHLCVRPVFSPLCLLLCLISVWFSAKWCTSHIFFNFPTVALNIFQLRESIRNLMPKSQVSWMLVYLTFNCRKL